MAVLRASETLTGNAVHIQGNMRVSRTFVPAATTNTLLQIGVVVLSCLGYATFPVESVIP